MIALPFLISTLMFTSSATTFVHHHNGGWCSGNRKIALTQKENYEIVHLPRISEAACRSRCQADAQCDFAQTYNHLAYAAGWPPHCQLHRNAYCDSEKLITTDIWFQVWLKASAIPPVTTANPTKDPTRNPSMNPTADPTAAAAVYDNEWNSRCGCYHGTCAFEGNHCSSGSWNAFWAAGDGYVNPPFPGAACACMSCVVECPRAADEPSKECKGEHESSLGENNFNDRGNGGLNWQTTYVYTLYNGYSCALSGWTHTRGYAKGFLTNAAGTNPNAKISGLTPNQEYKYSIYQFASSFAGTNGFTAPGANEIETTTNTNDEPTASGTFISDSNGEALFQFRRIAHHVHLSGISIAATCAEVPTASPSSSPTKEPSMNPTLNPTANPSPFPTANPTVNPTMIPTASPSQNPTTSPTRMPTASPSSSPTKEPSMNPTLNPTANPSPFPTAADFIIKIKAFHGKPSDIKVQAQPDVDVYLGNFEQKLTPVNGDRRLLSSDQQ